MNHDEAIPRENYNVAVKISKDEHIITDLSTISYINIIIENKSANLFRTLENVSIRVESSTAEAECQLRSDSSLLYPIKLIPQSKLTIILSCHGITLGTSLETVIFKCRTEDEVAFSIGFQVKITILEKKMLQSPVAENPISLMNRWQNCGRIIQGEKPFHAAPFLLAKLPHVEVPLKLWKVVLSGKNVLDVAPCLDDPLSIHNYIEKFSFLLFLEEIAMDIEMRKVSDLGFCFLLKRGGYFK